MKSSLIIGFSLTFALAADKKLDCGQCHAKQSGAFHQTGMARALEPAATGTILAAHKKLTFAQGDYNYAIERDGNTSWYRVSTGGGGELKLKIGWAFGQGAAGQTYLLEREGRWYESRVSYYKDIDSLDLTVGARPDPPRSLAEAMGREMSPKGAAECFSCHATGAISSSALKPDLLTPGVQCGRCHVDAEAHQAAFRSAPAVKNTPVKMGRFSAEEMSDFCGQCHRTWGQIAADGPHNITNVRFQPYRLTNSKCYDAADQRIRCTACHDVHQDVVVKASYYDAKCVACHTPGQPAGKRICKVAKQDCASCHMPKVKIESAHNAFTDHWIRIARQGEPAPY